MWKFFHQILSVEKKIWDFEVSKQWGGAQKLKFLLVPHVQPMWLKEFAKNPILHHFQIGKEPLDPSRKNNHGPLLAY